MFQLVHDNNTLTPIWCIVQLIRLPTTSKLISYVTYCTFYDCALIFHALTTDNEQKHLIRKDRLYTGWNKNCFRNSINKTIVMTTII